MPECKIQLNLSKCSCSYKPCSRKGLCCECVSYHRRNNKIPGCFFPKDVEKTYDRSVYAFIKSRQGK